MVKLSESMKIGFRLSLVNKLKNFLDCSLMVRCSYIMNGMDKIETMKYLQEFLVIASDLRSARSQQGTKAENSTLMKRSIQAVSGETSIWELKFYYVKCETSCMLSC